ncbi:MAG: MFS transporter [Candidatus Uhrbacteria bacterium]|nr:MFS transporter [Candidatus Uhrbacteria bacterium]
MRFRQVLFVLFPLWIFAFLFKFGGGLHYTLLPTIGERIFPIWLVGLLIGGSSFVQIILDVPTGYLLDRFGYVRLLKLGTAVFCVGAFFLIFGLQPWTYFVTLICSAVGWLFCSPGIDAYVLTMAPKKFAGQFMAMRDVVESGGIVAGMGVLSLVIHFSVPVLGAIVAAILVGAILALMRTPSERGSVHEEKKIAHQAFYVRRHFIHHMISALKKLNPASTLLLLSGFSSAAFYGIVWFVIPLLIARTVESGTLSLGLAIFDVSVLLIGFFLGRLTDRWSKRWLVFWGLLLFAVMALLLGFHFGWLFLVFGFLATTGDEMASISLWAWLHHLDKEHAEDGLISGLINLAQDLGWTVGPIMAGFLFQFVGPSWTIASGALLIFMTWVIAVFLTHTIPSPQKILPPPVYLPRQRRHKR